MFTLDSIEWSSWIIISAHINFCTRYATDCSNPKGTRCGDFKNTISEKNFIPIAVQKYFKHKN